MPGSETPSSPPTTRAARPSKRVSPRILSLLVVPGLVLFLLLLIPPTTPPVTTVVYGPGIAADSRANQQVGWTNRARVAYRFRATVTGQATNLRVQERGGNVYSGGDGGTIKASIQSDDNGIPSGTVLASVTWSPGNPVGAWEVWPQHTFDAPASLTAGTRYHLVFENVGTDPVANYISLNMLFTFGPTTTRRYAAYSEDFAALYAMPSTWKLEPDFLPIFDLTYADGGHDGQAYIGTLWDEYGLVNGAASMVRERFTVSGDDRMVTTAHVRLKRTSGTGALIVRLEKGDGTLIESVSVPSSAIAVGQIPDGSASSLAGDTWVTAPFAASHVLTTGQTYNLRLSTDAGTTYTVVPIQEGGSAGLLSRRFTDGDGQRTTDGGTSWSNLYSHDSVDVQFWLD
jgi:hypothetical protein